MKKSKVLLTLLALLLVLSVIFAAVSIGTFADESIKTLGAMVEIDANLSEYRLGDVKYIANDGYIGIPVQISVYHNGNESVTTGIGGTPIIVYVVNTNAERVGTDTDTEIIKSMLDRGYVVTVVDYLGDSKAVSPALDWSALEVTAKVVSGTYFADTGLPTSNLMDVYTVPAGHNISLGNVYWEIDKHSSSGTLEYIVKVWNTDFRSIFADTVIRWTDSDGNRKATQNGYDGSEPVWLNAGGTADANGQYIKIKHTLAEDIEDCVKPDGSPLDLNLYMNVIYPTNPEGDVPVMCLASSGDHLAQVPRSEGRPQFNGFLFNGYAGVVYDHGYVPMARADHYKEFSGSSANGVTGDNVTYSVSFYNDKKIHTAAMRFLRYLAASDETFAFDTEAIGVYGNSKGGWMQFIGEEHPELMVEKRFFEGHHGESRYEAGETAASTSGLIDGGTEQPWLNYGGVALDSGADLVYACCGGAEEHITDTHAPTFISCNASDTYGSYYASSNYFVNACRTHNVPTMWVDVKVGHTFTYGPETNFGFDTYDALFTFCGYYLKGDAVEVVYTSFTKDNASCSLSDDIIVKFSGAVDESEMTLVTLTDKEGNSVEGSWSSQFGNTEWTFTLSAPLSANTEYTLTVPASVKGDNGLAMGSDFVQEFTTKAENSSAVSFVQGSRGSYYYYDITHESAGADKYVLRFAVLNDANNLIAVYPVTSFSESNPDNSVVAAQPVAICGIDGAGIYECDVTAYVSTLAHGDTAAFLLQSSRAAGESVVFSAPLDSWSGISGGNATYEISSEISETEGTGALKVTGFNLTSTSGSEKLYYYANSTKIITASVFKSGSVTKEDSGRTFTVTFRVYDTVSRRIQANLNSATSSVNGVADYYATRHNFTTVAGEWVEFSIDYTVYEPELYGTAGEISKTLNIYAETLGDESEAYPIYIDSIETVKKVSAAELSSSAALVFEQSEFDPLETPYGRLDDIYADTSKYPIAIFVKSGNDWAFKTATSMLPTSYNYGADTVILLRDNYALSSQNHNIDTVGAGRTLTLDLGGYTLDITGGGQYYSFSSSAKVNNVTFNMINGKVYSNGKASLVCIYSNGSNTVNLNYKDIDFTLGASFSETSALVRHGYHSPATYTATYNITFTDCNIDVSAVNKEDLRVIRAGYSSSGGYVLNWRVNGGSLKTGTAEFLPNNIVTENGGSLVFGKGSNGKYLELIMTADLDNAMVSYNFNFDDGNSRYFCAVSTDGVNYVHEPLSLVTPYGTISNTNLSALKYPFVSFYNGAYKNAGDFFANNPNMEYGIRSLDGAVVLMRRDYKVGSGVNFTNLSHHQGLIVFDLGGYTLDTTIGHKNGVFRSTGMNGSFATHLKVYNGTVFAANPIISIETYASNGEGKVQSFTLENLNIISTGTCLFNYNTPTVANMVNININGCSIDFEEATTVNDVFKAGAGDDGLFATTLTVKNTDLWLHTFKESFVTEYGNDSVVFDTTDGNFTLYLPKGEASPTGAYSTTDGEKILLKAGSEGEYDFYTLQLSSTKYGSLPVEYMSASEYPILVYVKDGDGWAFREAYASLPHSFTFGADAVILLRGDIAIDSSVYNLDSITSGASLIFDLNGNTLDLTSGGQYWNFKTAFKTDFSVTFKDGNLTNGGKANFISLVSEGSATQSITLENIDYKLIGSGTADGNLLTRYNGSSTTDTGKLNLTVKNCNIDTTANSTTTLRIFQAGRYDGMFNVNYTVIGGTVKTASYHDKMFYSENGSTVTFLPGTDGKNTIISLPAGSVLTQIIYYDGNGEKIYMVEQSTDGTYDVYMPESLVTPYGTIAWSNSSRADYPFLAFVDNGDGTYTYVTKSSDYFVSGGMEYSLRSKASSVVLMRRDFHAEGYQNNLSNNPNILVFDLGGYTLTVGSKSGAFCNTAKHSTTTTVTIKNGAVLLDDYHFLTFDSSAGGAGKVFNFTFEDLTFEYAEGAAVSSPYKFNTVVGAFELNLTFTDCTFKLDSNCPAGSLILAAAIEGIDLDVKVSGGNIIADSLEDINISNALSNITFTRNENNEYMTVTLPLGVSAPTSVFTTDLGEMTLVCLGTDGGYAVYYLRDESKLISPKASLTLYSDFVYNLYIPATDFVVAITLDGVVYELDGLDTVEVQGVEYYCIAKRIAVGKACDEFTLIIEMQVFEGKTHTASWTLGIIPYVQNLLDGNYTDTVKTLARDILSYIRAVYTYAGLDEKDVARIDAIIGENYDDSIKPDTDVDAAFDVDGLSSAALELGDAPSFRFYIDGNYDVAAYRFTVNGNAVKGEVMTDGERTYIRVSLYAYAMTDTVSYTIDGTDISGEYNLKSYYDFAKAEGSATLVRLVERLWKYSESAALYKAEVTA